jgi:hypothetical protein
MITPRAIPPLLLIGCLACTVHLPDEENLSTMATMDAAAPADAGSVDARTGPEDADAGAAPLPDAATDAAPLPDAAADAAIDAASTPDAAPEPDAGDGLFRDLVAYWSFDVDEGPVARDQSGNGHVATLTPGPT